MPADGTRIDPPPVAIKTLRLMENFNELKLHERLQYAVKELGYSTPTPIQAISIPEILAGRDVIGLAKTGTGKTAAFTLPTLQRFLEKHYDNEYEGLRVLILSPTRELAAQVAENFDTYSKNHRLTKALLIGGVSFKDQDSAIDKGVDVLLEAWPQVRAALPETAAATPS